MSKKSGATSLSNGTLSLRFMQRGATQPVTTAAAKVSDEAEWDIGPTARAALGAPSGLGLDVAGKSPFIRVIHDESYIPFIFDYSASDSSGQQSAKSNREPDPIEPGRRRIFRQGTEVKFETPPKAETDEEPTEREDMEKQTIGSSTSGKAKQPKSISSSLSRSTPGLAPANDFGVRRHRLEAILRPPGGSTARFMKPTGVVSTMGAGVKRTHEDDSRPHEASRRKR